MSVSVALSRFWKYVPSKLTHKTERKGKARMFNVTRLQTHLATLHRRENVKRRFRFDDDEAAVLTPSCGGAVTT